MTYSSDWICPTSNQHCNNCPQVVRKWDTYRLLEDLARAKTEFLCPRNNNVKIRRLTKAEICWLHLLLFGLNPDEIARQLSRGNIRPELARSIYRYVELLTGNRISDWAQVRLYLENQGYRIEPVSREMEKSKLIKLTVLLQGNLLHPADLIEIITQNIKGGSLKLKSYYYEEEEEENEEQE